MDLADRDADGRSLRAFLSFRTPFRVPVSDVDMARVPLLDMPRASRHVITITAR
jgi:hypothetical protein